MKGFYRYISKNKNGYRILKDGEDYGSFLKLSDALYERDRFEKANWNWDALMELAETDNPYEKMILPPFIHEHSYIYRICTGLEVYKDDEYYGKFNNKTDAYAYAEEIGGTVVESNWTYRVQKRINGSVHTFGQYKNYEDARKRRDELLEKGWIE